jgi:hypothetical protein
MTNRIDHISKIKVFLGGTCNESDWREKLIELLNINYFNPVVDDWNVEAQLKEIEERKICDYCFYTCFFVLYYSFLLVSDSLLIEEF